MRVARPVVRKLLDPAHAPDALGLLGDLDFTLQSTQGTIMTVAKQAPLKPDARKAVTLAYLRAVPKSARDQVVYWKRQPAKWHVRHLACGCFKLRTMLPSEPVARERIMHIVPRLRNFRVLCGTPSQIATVFH
jgi:hypothetical protein